MIPKILKLEGLNCFQQRQVIDFEKLTKNGLFGIFGNTGTGKSTILDAIILVLYGYIPRNSHDFINSYLDTAYIYFEFKINVNSNYKLYISERTFKRKKDGGYNCKCARIYEKNDEKNITIIAEGSNNVSKKSEEIIGLKSEDFMRTVILPQGKFSEFLTLSSKNRNDMLERIFHLEKYGKELETKIKKQKSDIDIELHILNSKISMYEEYTEENLKLENDKYTNLIKSIEPIKQKISENRENFNKFKEIYQLQMEKNIYEEQYQEILKLEKNINLKKEKLSLAIQADFINVYIKDYKDIEKKLYTIKDDIEKKSIELNDTAKELEKIKINYNKSKYYKDSKYEILLKQEEKLRQALEILDKVKMLEIEKENIKNECNKYDKKIQELEIYDHNNNINIDNIKSEIQNIILKKKDCEINPEFKQSIEKAYQYSNKYKDISNTLDIKIKKILNYNNSINILEKEKQNLLKENKKIKDKIFLLKQSLNYINNSDYSNSDILLELQQNCNTIVNKYKEIKEKENLSEKIKNKIFQLNILKTQNEKDYKLKTEEILKCEDNIKTFNTHLEALKVISEASILAQLLEDNKPCPVCGSLEHPKPTPKIEENIISKLSEQIKNLKEYLIEIQKDSNKILSDINIYTRDLNNFNTELLELNTILMNENSIKLFEQKEKEIKEFENIKQKIQMLNDRKNKIEINLTNKNDSKNKLDIEITRIIESQKKDIQNKEELKIEILDLLKQKQYLENIINEYIEKLGVNNFETENENILLKQKELLNLERIENETRKDLIVYENIKTETLNNLIETKKNFDILSEKYKQKNNIIDNYNNDIKILSQNKNPKKYIIEIQQKIKKICDEEKSLHIELEIISNKNQELLNVYSGLKNQKQTLTELLSEKNDILIKSLKENNIDNIETVKNYLIENHEQKLMSDEILKYEKKYDNITNNLNRLEKKLLGRTIEQNSLNNMQYNLESLNQKLEQSNMELAILNEKISIAKLNIQEKKILENLKKEFVHKSDLLEELIKLTKGNKFIKFISQHQMKYMAREATNYLKKITKNRYAIEIDDENEFIIRDDFSGGIRRKPDTLSGGEIFLTSLSLALALSSQIQSRNKSSLEFFFLDEGFGSLDSILLDTVIQSLESLHHEYRNIGIISHVEELKNRIGVKLIVTSTQYNEEGSKIQLEIS